MSSVTSSFFYERSIASSPKFGVGSPDLSRAATGQVHASARSAVHVTVGGGCPRYQCRGSLLCLARSVAAFRVRCGGPSCRLLCRLGAGAVERRHECFQGVVGGDLPRPLLVLGAASRVWPPRRRAGFAAIPWCRTQVDFMTEGDPTRSPCVSCTVCVCRAPASSHPSRRVRQLPPTLLAALHRANRLPFRVGVDNPKGEEYRPLLLPYMQVLPSVASAEIVRTARTRPKAASNR